jgi:hypothetical protein
MKKSFFLSVAILALLGLSGWTVHAHFQRSSPARVTWEYKSVVLTRTINAPNFTWTEDGRELPGSPDMIAKARDLGDQGWELVTITPLSAQTGQGYTGFTNALLYWFKRPK